MSLYNNSFQSLEDNTFGILNNISDPILIFHEEKIVFSNKPAAELFEYDQSDYMLTLKLSDITSQYEKRTDM